MSDVSLIVRACGERTTQEAIRILGEVFPNQTVQVVTGIPFATTLRRSLEIGIDENKTWTLCIDADVAVLKRGIKQLLAVARLQPVNVFEIQGLVIDKFFGFARPCGNHLYRTSFLKEAVKHVPDSKGTLRPEFTMIKKMETKGKLHVQLPTIVGIHDFEQFYVDVYRKCHLQSKKHTYLADQLMARWKRLKNLDADFRVATHAFREGLDQAGIVSVDKNEAEEQRVESLANIGVSEKGLLPEGSISDEYIYKIVRDYFLDDDIPEHEAEMVAHFFVKQNVIRRSGLIDYVSRALRWVSKLINRDLRR